MQGITSLPVLLVAFRRPDTTRLALEAIRRVRPPRIYFAVDGPRPDDAAEASLVREVQEFLTGSVDWDCEVRNLFREENLGCARGVSSAISWFFEQEEAGVIIEDDCVPVPGFFRYCEELLSRYADDESVMHISGNSRARLQDPGTTYFFSRYPQVWGWATWRRSWERFSFEQHEPEPEMKKVLSRFSSTRERQLWETQLQGTFDGEIDSWAYRWAYALWLNDGVSAYPSMNMVDNVGFGSDSTHTRSWSLSRLTMPAAEPVEAIVHPESTEIRDDLDARVFKLAYSSRFLPARMFQAARTYASNRSIRR